MAAKPSGKFDTSIANLWTHCASHDRNEFIELSLNLKKKKKKKNYYLRKSITNNILVDPSSLFLLLFTILLRTRAPKGHTLSKRGELFSYLERKSCEPPSKRTGILETPQSGTRYLTEETSNLKTDAPTIRHTAETVKGAAGFCQVAFEKFDVSRSALNIVTWPT